MDARLSGEIERAFLGELRRLAARIAFDASADVRRQHVYKTYALVVACAEASEADGEEFFVLGAHRPSEKARAHLHSSFATGLFNLEAWAAPAPRS